MVCSSSATQGGHMVVALIIIVAVLAVAMTILGIMISVSDDDSTGSLFGGSLFGGFAFTAFGVVLFIISIGGIYEEGRKAGFTEGVCAIGIKVGDYDAQIAGKSDDMVRLIVNEDAEHATCHLVPLSSFKEEPSYGSETQSVDVSERHGFKTITVSK